MFVILDSDFDLLKVPKSSLKSLEQREAEYAEARQRILGNEASPAPPTKPTPANKQNGRRPTEPGIKKHMVTPGGDQRTPKGPDGTKGFQHHRR